ncbi:MAG: hypothetical protein AB1486_13095 [Planctomycetota bacterium]
MAVWLALVFFFGAAAVDDDVVIRLKSGHEVVGVLVEFDEARGVLVRRHDNGGLLRLVWDQILPEDVRRIRHSQGYVEEEPEVLFTDAMRLVLNDGREVFGIVESTEGDRIVLRQKGQSIPYQKARIRKAEEVRVEALEVYTSEELYQEHVSERPPATALDNYNAGIFCESIARYDLARKHFEAARELDPEFKPDEVEQKIRVCETKLAAADQTERLAEIKNLIFQKKFERAIELATAFEKEFPGSVLIAEAVQLLRRAEQSRDAYLTERASGEFLSLLDNQADRMAIDRELDLKAAMTTMRDSVGNLVLARVAERLKVDLEKLKSLWPQRKKGTFVVTASYGGGTFVLRDRAYDGLLEEDAAEKPSAKKEEKKKEDDSIKGKIERIIEERKKKGQERAKGSRRRGNLFDVPPTPDEWWLQAPTSERKQFLLAWFGENSEGLVEVVSVRARECQACAGLGYIERMQQRESPSRDPCARCKGLTFDRVVKFR